MDKKTSSEWGSDEDWESFIPLIEHFDRCFRLNNEYTVYIAALYSLDRFGVQGITRRAARQLAVEKYCNETGASLPWLPDYDLSTEAGCREAIESRGYTVNTISKIELFNSSMCRHVERSAGATLLHWQEAAQWAIDNPVGENNE